MKHLLIIGNIILIFLFWIAGLAVITPAYNHFVQYAQQGFDLPSPTLLVIRYRFLSVALPFCWGFFLYFKYWKNNRTKEEFSNSHLLMLTLSTQCIGLAMLIIFLIAGILPFLKIGVLIQ